MPVSEEKFNQQYKQIIQPIIFKAFQNVKLEDGIGYFEADAIDDYFEPESDIYQQQKAKDEREDWQKVLNMIEGNDGKFNNAVNCFMDAKGLRFFLPVMLSLRKIWCDLDFWFESYLEKSHTSYVEMINLLNKEQKQCILQAFFQDFLCNAEWNLAYNTFACDVCSKTRRQDYTLEQAKLDVFESYRDLYELAIELENNFFPDEKNKILKELYLFK